jgi:hypothetical protein
MYQEFTLLSARYVTSAFRCCGLCVVDRGDTLISLALDSPFTLMRQDVLILSRHHFNLHFSCISLVRETMAVRESIL